jgi:serine/threonine protein kinase
MAPEKVLGEGAYTIKAELYSIGVTLFLMLYGYHPYRDRLTYG